MEMLAVAAMSPHALKQQQEQTILDDATFQKGFIDSLGMNYHEVAEAQHILCSYIDCSGQQNDNRK